MSEEITVEEAIATVWRNCPDEMQRIVDEMQAMRELKFSSIREAKRYGSSADWIEGEMLAYDEMRENLLKPSTAEVAPI